MNKLCLQGFLIIGLALNFSNSKANNYDGACMLAPQVASVNYANVTRVDTEPELQEALKSVVDGAVILIAPGIYNLTSTLSIGTDNVTISGDSTRCDEIVLVGKGMEDASGKNDVPHGIWTGASNTHISNLTIRDVYHHAISISGKAEAPKIYNVRMIDIGEQFVKSNPIEFGKGVSNGSIEYSVMRYSMHPPKTDHGGGTGYTNGVDVHAGNNWYIGNNRFENFHTPDDADHLWNPAVLMWNGTVGSIVENNQFFNVDRAIAFGLRKKLDDHSGGIIRNNMIYIKPDLHSARRSADSDAAIVLWSSRNTQVLHNTIVTSGNIKRSIELRFDSSGSVVKNNLVDAPISHRNKVAFEKSDNYKINNTEIFRDVFNADLRLKEKDNGIYGLAPVLPNARRDIDGHMRGCDNGATNVGADAYASDSSKCL